MILKELKKGEYFTRKNIPYPTDNQVYIRGDYDRTSKKYSCLHFNDINREIFLKGDTIIYTDFTF